MTRARRVHWWYAGSLVVVLFTLFPLYLMVKISISPPQEVLTPHPSFGLRAVATWAMIAAVAVAAPAAYVMSRLSPAWKYGLILVLFASRMVPEVGIALPVAVRFLAWLESWNELTYALYLSLSENTLPLQIYYYVTRGSWFDAATYATLLAVPVVVVTACLQRYLKAGYLAGAVKG